MAINYSSIWKSKNRINLIKSKRCENPRTQPSNNLLPYMLISAVLLFSTFWSKQNCCDEFQVFLLFCSWSPSAPFEAGHLIVNTILTDVFANGRGVFFTPGQLISRFHQFEEYLLTIFYALFVWFFNIKIKNIAKSIAGKIKSSLKFKINIWFRLIGYIYSQKSVPVIPTEVNCRVIVEIVSLYFYLLLFHKDTLD